MPALGPARPLAVVTRADEYLADLAAAQLGGFSRAQAHEVGVTDHQLRRRVERGLLVRAGPNAFRFAGAPSTLESELRDLVADVGAPCWVSGPTAAALHEFDGFSLRRPFHLVVPRHRCLTRPTAVVHRWTRIEPIDRCTLDGLAVLSPTRTLIDLATSCDAQQLAAALDSALRDGRASERLVHRRVVALRSQGRYGLPLLASVLAGHEVTRGGHSWLEREFLRLIHDAGLPRPEMQQVLSRAGDRLVRVDARFPGTPVVVELLGYRFHRTRRQMTSDAARANALLGDGFQPYQFTYGQMVAEQRYVLDTVASALRRYAA